MPGGDEREHRRDERRDDRPSRPARRLARPRAPRRRTSRPRRRRSARARLTTAARSTTSARFQAIAPIRPANTISSVISVGVDDARGDRRRDRERQERADEIQRSRRIATATRGAIARVEIDVATAFAVSWKPLVKSNASAVATTIHEDDVVLHRFRGY